MSYSLTDRVLSELGDATRIALRGFKSAWRERAAHNGQARALEMMADIDAHTLRDIGAPNWLIAQAVERKDAHHLHLLNLYRS